MITDRTELDVINAKAARQKLWRGEMLTADEITALERGCATVGMLNRIEGKQAELAGELTSYLYGVSIQNKNDWSANDIYTADSFERLTSNLDKLKSAFYVYETTPQTPSALINYQQANDIEKILEDIETNLNYMKSKFRKCGTFKSGE